MCEWGIFQEKVGSATEDVKSAIYQKLESIKKDEDWSPAKGWHPTTKPLALMEYLCTLTATPTKGIVLDPFCGSGTVGVVARRLHRHFIGIELNPEYAELSRERIKNRER